MRTPAATCIPKNKASKDYKYKNEKLSIKFYGLNGS